jgi:magnesium transporter
MIRKRKHKIGISPGTLIAPEKADPKAVKITIIDYGPEHLKESVCEKLEETFPFAETPSITWINVEGLGDADVIKKLGEKYHLHPLALEDVLNIPQRPKFEEYESHYFIVLRMLKRGHKVEQEQISFFLGRNFLITFQETVGDVFDPVRERIRKGKTRIRSSGPDYLAYALIDTLVDSYFPILENSGETLEALEDETLASPSAETIQKVHQLKRELLSLRRAVWPARDAISAMQREDLPLLKKQTRVFLRDCYDHSIQIMDIVETYREIASGLVDLYLSTVSNKMNEVMKVLTIIATIFIPIGVVAGIYGMNFNPDISPFNMPELNWFWGYPFALLLMVLIAGGMVIYFKRKDWL